MPTEGTLPMVPGWALTRAGWQWWHVAKDSVALDPFPSKGHLGMALAQGSWPKITPSTLVLEGNVCHQCFETGCHCSHWRSLVPWVYKNLYPHVPGSTPPAQRGWSKLDFPSFWIVFIHPLLSHCIFGLPSFGMRH